MPTFLQELLTQVKDIWARLDGGQRLQLVAVAAVAAAVLIAAGMFANQPSYVDAFVSTDATELSDASQALSRAGLEVRSEARAVQVRGDQLDTARRVLREGGFEAGSSASDALEVNVADSRVVAELKIWRSKKREVEKALESQPQILDAMVTANNREPHIFRKIEAGIPRTASVFLKLKPGVSIHTMAPIAKAAVEAEFSIPAESILVHDQHGNTIGGSEQDVGMSSGLREREASIALFKQANAQRILNEAYGGYAKVAVSVALDPKLERQRTPFAETQVLRRKDKTTKQIKDNRSSSGGDPSIYEGTKDEQTSLRNQGPVTRPELSEKTTDETTEYAEPGTREWYQTAHRIQQVVANVVVDPRVVEWLAGKEKDEIEPIDYTVLIDEATLDEQQKALKKRIDAVQADIQKVVAKAIGLRDPSKFKFTLDDGSELTDHLDVSVGRIDPPEPLEAPGPSLLPEALELNTVLQFAGVGLVLLFLRNLLKTASTAGGSRAGAASSAPNPAGGSGDAGISPQGAQGDEAIDPDERARRLRREIERKIAEDPAAMSRLLEVWLSEQAATGA